MAITSFYEARDSRVSTEIPPSLTLKYHALETTNDSAAVRVYATGATAAFVAHERGTLYRQDIKVNPRGYGVFSVEVPYAPREKESGEYQISFDTSGGSLRITNSKQTIAKYARPDQPAPPDMGGAIGVNGDDVEGAEVTIPALRLDVSFTHPEGIITLAAIKNLARWTGKVNSAPFLTFDPGEVLFLGASGSEGTDVETTIRYSFACSENIVGQIVGDITVASKKGWEVAWIAYEDHVEDGKPAKRPKWVYVERVYETINLAQALGFGG